MLLINITEEAQHTENCLGSKVHEEHTLNFISKYAFLLLHFVSFLHNLISGKKGWVDKGLIFLVLFLPHHSSALPGLASHAQVDSVEGGVQTQPPPCSTLLGFFKV